MLQTNLRASGQHQVNDQMLVSGILQTFEVVWQSPLVKTGLDPNFLDTSVSRYPRRPAEPIAKRASKARDVSNFPHCGVIAKVSLILYQHSSGHVNDLRTQWEAWQNTFGSIFVLVSVSYRFNGFHKLSYTAFGGQRHRGVCTTCVYKCLYTKIFIEECVQSTYLHYTNNICNYSILLWDNET